MNTLFTYLYRDASNYKQWGSVVFGGECPESLKQRFEAALEGGEFFIADQIRIPELFPDTWPGYDDDHCWHESAGFETVIDSADDALSRTIEQFVDETERAASAGWRVFDPLRRLSKR